VIKRAAPVGVVSSPVVDVAKVGASLSNSTVAGPGAGYLPCRHSIVPCPTFTGPRSGGPAATPPPQAWQQQCPLWNPRHDFMKMDFIGMLVVDFAFGFRQPAKRRDRFLPDPVREAARFDHRANFSEGPVVMAVMLVCVTVLVPSCVSHSTTKRAA